MGKMRKKGIALFLACFVYATFMLQAQERLEVDSDAPSSKQPTIEDGPNDVPIVNITTPSPAGVSHNVFKEYNVDRQGIVFNNNHNQDPNPEQGFHPSHLTKQPLFINENLQGRPASAILTEVSGLNPSNLLGYTEIYGNAADFILANPNGIFCDGAGFINANRITLTTGQPQLDFEGALKALNVDQGLIEIKGKGLLTSPPDFPASPLDILSRAAKISAALWSQAQVNIYTGKNQFDYQNKTLTPSASTQADKPHLAIDAALLGNISARKIIIVATEKGVGVNCPALLADTDNIEITAEGTIQLRDIQAAQDLMVESHEEDIAQSASQSLVQGNLKLAAPQGNINLSSNQFYTQGNAQIASKNLNIGPQTNFLLGSNAKHSVPLLDLHVQDTLINQGKITIPTLSATPIRHVDNQGIIRIQQDLRLAAQTIRNAGDVIVSQGSMKLSAQDGFHNEKLMASAQALTIETKKELNNGGLLQAKQQLVFTAGTLHNQGKVTSQGAATIQTQKATHNNNLIFAAQELSVKGGQLHNAGQLSAQHAVKLDTKSIHNTGQIISQAGHVTLAAQEHIHNDQLINSARALYIQAHKELTNQGSLVATERLQAKAQSIDNQGTIASRQAHVSLAAQDHINNEKTMVGATGLVVEAQGPIENKGQVIAHQDLRLQGQALTNTGDICSKAGNANLIVAHKLYNEKAIIAAGSLGIKAKQLANQGAIRSQQVLQASTKNIHNSGEIKSKGNASLKAQDQVYNEQVITSDKALSLEAATIINEYQLNTPDTLQIATQSLQNKGQLTATSLITHGPYELNNTGSIQTQTDLTLNTQSCYNTGKITVAQGSLKLEAQGKVYNKEVMASAASLSITTKQGTVNEGSLTTHHNLAIHAQSLTNAGTIANQEGDMRLTAQDAIHNAQAITSAKALNIQSGSLTNRGQLVGTGALKLQTGPVNNQGDILGGLTGITAQGGVHNERVIFSNSGLQLTTDQELHNQGQVVATNDLDIDARAITNQGEIAGGANSSLIATDKVYNKKVISSTENLCIKTQQGLENKGQLGAQQDLQVVALAITNTGAIIGGQGSTTLAAQNEIDNTDTIVSAGSLQLEAHQIKNQAKIAANERLAIKSRYITNQGEMTSGGEASLAAQDSLCNEQEIASAQLLRLETGQLTNNGQITTTEELQLHTPIINNAGEISASLLTHTATPVVHNQGNIYVQNDLKLTTQSLNNTGEIIVEEGSLKLSAQGTIHNAQVIASAQALTIDSKQQLVNNGLLQATCNLNLTAPTLTNKGKLKNGSGTAKLQVQDHLHNQQTITSAGQLHIATRKLTNDGQLATNGELKLTTQTIDNQGDLAGDIATIAASASIHNKKHIRGGQKLYIDTGQLNNQGQLVANYGLTLETKGDLDNRGEIKSQQGNATLKVSGKLCNTKTIDSARELNIQTGRVLENTDQITTQGQLELTAQAIINKGTIVASTGSTIKSRGDIDNTKAISSGRDLHIEAAGKIQNASNGNVAAAGALSLKAGRLDNQGTIAGGGEHTIIATIRSDINNQRKITGTKQVTLVSQGNIYNTGTIASGTDLKLQSPTIHNKGVLAGKKGNISLLASNGLENSQPIISGQDLVVATNSLKNRSRLVACRNLQITTQSLANDGEIKGGSGENNIQAKGYIYNNKIMASVRGLHIEAKALENNGQLTANQALKITAQSLRNESNITGGQGTTTLTVTHSLINQKTIASVGDLGVKVDTGRLENQGQIAANRNLQIQAKSLQGQGSITGGEGQTKLEIQEDIYNETIISSTHNLTIETKQKLHNKGRIASGHNLEIRANKLENKPGGEIEGGQVTTLIHTAKDINNHGLISGDATLKLEALQGRVYNNGKIQGVKGLTIIASDVTNTSEKVIFSGADMTMQLTGRLYNDEEGEIFAQGNMTLEGQNNQPAQEIENYVGRIEAIGDITIKVHELENKGSISWDGNGYYTNTRRVGSAGWESYSVTHEQDVVSTTTTNPAYINARRDLYLCIINKAHNYGSVIAAGGNMYVRGRNVSNERPSRNVYISDYYRYKKKWIEKKVDGGKVTAAVLTLGISTAFVGVSNSYTRSDVYYSGKTVTIYSTDEPICRAGKDMAVHTQKLTNGTPISSVEIAHQESPLEKLQETQTISVTSHITLPTSQYGLFKLNIDPLDATGATTTHPTPSLAVQVTLPTLPTYAAPEVASAATATTHPSINMPEVDTPEFIALHHPAPTSADAPDLPACELPEAPTAEAPVTGLEDIATDFAPETPSLQIKLPPPPAHSYLIVSNVKVDLKRFYGSPYFLKKLNIQQEHPLRFLGDPFYESRLINESILQATTKPYLSDEIATPEEQVQYLIDNTAAAAKDLNLSLGVALSKEQINTLKKDIIWYVEETVLGQKVLTPQVYLSKATIEALKSPTGTGMHARGNMQLDVKEELTNTGNISSKGNLKVNAGSIRNETLGQTQATIQSTDGVADVQAKDDIKNFSGKIAGKKAARVKSENGSIINETKLLNDSTLHTQASIESDGNLIVDAKEDFINKAAKVRATKNASIKAGRDVKFLTQELTTRKVTTTGSSKSGWFSQEEKRKQSSQKNIQHAVSDIAIGGNLTVEGRDLVFEGTDVDVKGNATFNASRDFVAVSAAELEEKQSLEQETSIDPGIFSSSAHTKTKTSQSKSVTHKLAKFNIGGHMAVNAGRDARLIGTDLEAEKATIKAKGKTEIREVYNTEDTENIDSGMSLESKFLGLSREQKRHNTVNKSGHRKGAGGNQWKVNNLTVEGVGDVYLEKLDVKGRDGKSRSQNISITSKEGKVYDCASIEYNYAETKSDRYRERRGLFIGSEKEQETTHSGTGKEAAEQKALQAMEEARRRAQEAKEAKKKESSRIGSLKLYEEKQEKVQSKAREEQVIGSHFYAENVTIESKNKTVTLEGTQIDASGDAFISGKKGVDILSAKAQDSQEVNRQSTEKEISIGIKNKLKEVGQAGEALCNAYEELKTAKKAYGAYRAQLSQMEEQYKAGHISEEEYQEYRLLEGLHVAAITASSAKLATKAKALPSSVLSAIASYKTGGFSLDIAASMEQTLDQAFSKDTHHQSANIRANNITIKSEEGNLTLEGSHLKAANLIDIDVVDVLTRAATSSNKSGSTQQGWHGKATADVNPFNLGATGNPAKGGALDTELGVERGGSQSTSQSHEYSSITGNTIKLNVRGNMDARGAIIHAREQVEGTIQGDLIVETLQDSKQGSHGNKQASIDLGIGANKQLSAGLGGGYDSGKEDELWTNTQSQFTAGGKFDLKVGGKTHNIGSKIGSESGQTQLETQEYIEKDLNDHKTSHEVGLNAHVSFDSKLKPQGGQAGVHFSYNKARKKTLASLGQGTITQTGKTTQPLQGINRNLNKGGVNLYATGTRVAVDSETVKVVADPKKAAKEVIEDGKKLYSVGEGLVSTLNKAHKLGATATIKELGNSIQDVCTISDLAESELAETINKATDTDAQELQGAFNEGLHYLQDEAGIQEKDQADVKLYQGQDQAIQHSATASELSNYKASYNKATNEVYVNTQGTDISRGDDIQRSIYTELQRKETADSRLLSKLSDDQQRELAYSRGDRAARLWKRFSDPSTRSNPSAAQAWNERNSAPLQRNNQRVGRANSQDVDPRVLEHLDPRYYRAKARGDHQRAKQIKAEWEAVENGLIETSNGFANAVSSNLVGGIGREEGGSAAFQRGQVAGDIASMAIGAAEIAAGGGMMAGSGVAVATTGGGAIPIGGVAVAEGTAIAAHGINTAKTAAEHLAKGSRQVQSQQVEGGGKGKGTIQGAKEQPRVQPKELLRKGGGKNSAHANPDARNTARENWEKAKDDLERFKQTQRGTSDFKKKLRKFEKQVKHWWGKANFSGETHSRNAKGN